MTKSNQSKTLKARMAAAAKREYSRQYRAANRERINEQNRAWRAANPDKVKETRTKSLWGWGTKDHKKLIKSLGGKCAICGSKHDLVVDHDHVTGEVRGVLCPKHNMALGQFGDSYEGIEKAYEYQRKARTEGTGIFVTKGLYSRQLPKKARRQRRSTK